MKNNNHLTEDQKLENHNYLLTCHSVEKDRYNKKRNSDLNYKRDKRNKWS